MIHSSEALLWFLKQRPTWWYNHVIVWIKSSSLILYVCFFFYVICIYCKRPPNYDRIYSRNPWQLWRMKILLCVFSLLLNHDKTTRDNWHWIVFSERNWDVGHCHVHFKRHYKTTHVLCFTAFTRSLRLMNNSPINHISLNQNVTVVI